MDILFASTCSTPFGAKHRLVTPQEGRVRRGLPDSTLGLPARNMVVQVANELQQGTKGVTCWSQTPAKKTARDRRAGSYGGLHKVCLLYVDVANAQQAV